QRAEPGQRRDGIGAIRLGGPDGVDAQPVRFLYQLDRQLQPAGSIAQHDAESHGGSPVVWWMVEFVAGKPSSLKTCGLPSRLSAVCTYPCTLLQWTMRQVAAAVVNEEKRWLLKN